MSSLYFLKAWGISGRRTEVLFHQGEMCDNPDHAWSVLLEKVREFENQRGDFFDIMICSIKKNTLVGNQTPCNRAYKRNVVDGVVEYVIDETFYF